MSALRDRIAGLIDITGRPFRRFSVCRLCGLDSGPWLTRQAAEVSSLLHLTSHHSEERHTAAIAEATREWAKADREVVAAIGQGGPNHWRRWADLNAREKAARLALRAVVDAERNERSQA